MKARLSLVTAMLIFGTIGIFVRSIPLPSAVIAMTRGFIGVIFLFFLSLLWKKPLSGTAIRKNRLLLLISGTAIGLNWVLLFEAYRYTTVATATLCYYLAPIFVILLSPLVLKERLTVKKILCALCAILGMVFLSGFTDGTIGGLGDLRGILLGVGAAMLYASIVLMNRKLTNIGAFDKTMVQLGASAIVLLIYNLLSGGLWEIRAAVTANPMTPILLLVLGIVHTGIAYTLYFSSLSADSGMSSQTAAVLSYIDPASAILLSAIFLREPMTGSGIIGTVLILGAAIVSELSLPERRKNRAAPRSRHSTIHSTEDL